MTNDAIRTIIRDRLGIDVMPDGLHVDANAVHLAVKEANKRDLIHDVADALERLLRPGSEAYLQGYSALLADPQEVAEAVAVVVQEAKE